MEKPWEQGCWHGGGTGGAKWVGSTGRADIVVSHIGLGVSGQHKEKGKGAHGWFWARSRATNSCSATRCSRSWRVNCCSMARISRTEVHVMSPPPPVETHPPTIFEKPTWGCRAPQGEVNLCSRILDSSDFTCSCSDRHSTASPEG